MKIENMITKTKKTRLQELVDNCIYCGRGSFCENHMPFVKEAVKKTTIESKEIEFTYDGDKYLYVVGVDELYVWRKSNRKLIGDGWRMIRELAPEPVKKKLREMGYNR